MTRDHIRSKFSSPPKKARRGRPPTHNHAEIMLAAKAAFSKGGYAGVSLDKLAAQLKTKKGSLYYHSNRKVDLLIAISRGVISEAASEINKIVLVGAPAEIRFELAMRALMKSLLSDTQSAKVYFENEADLPSAVQVELRRVLRKIQETLILIIADGVKEGSFAGDPRILVKHVLAVANWPYRWFDLTGNLSLDEFIKSSTHFMLSAMRAPKASASRRPRNAIKSM